MNKKSLLALSLVIAFNAVSSIDASLKTQSSSATRSRQQPSFALSICLGCVSGLMIIVSSTLNALILRSSWERFKRANLLIKNFENDILEYQQNQNRLIGYHDFLTNQLNEMHITENGRQVCLSSKTIEDIDNKLATESRNFAQFQNNLVSNWNAPLSNTNQNTHRQYETMITKLETAKERKIELDKINSDLEITNLNIEDTYCSLQYTRIEKVVSLITCFMAGLYCLR